MPWDGGGKLAYHKLKLFEITENITSPDHIPKIN